METLAKRLKEGMVLRGMKQVDLVEITGINKGSLSSYLSGRYSPKRDAVTKLAEALNVSESWLLGASDADLPEVDRLSPGEKDLLEKYRKLNSSGKEAVDRYASDLLEIARYTE